ncbi:MAG TPA: tetratricopeptide repeat protein, partial [Verrucomicrobiae bacterium]
MRPRPIDIALFPFRSAWLIAWISASLLAAHGQNETHEPGAKDHSSAKAPSNDPATPPAPTAVASTRSIEINDALRQSSHLIANSNVLTSLHAPKQGSLQDQARILFDLARRHHAQKSYTEATRNFTALLESVAPDELKRQALIELAVMAQEQNQLAKAQQILAQYLKQYPQDPGAPEVMLRQGLLYRQMGATTLALSKFYAVMTSALTLKEGSLDYYQRLVLHAQTEIAETYYLQGKNADAVEYLSRLLKLDSPELNKTQIHYKLVRSLAALDNHTEAIAQAKDFLVRYPASTAEPEVRFLLANALKCSGQNRDALQQVLLLLQSQQSSAGETPDQWAYWQQRAGNEIANQMYNEGDYMNALEIYSVLASLNQKPGWQLPVWYQTGLVYEKLHQPQ